MDPEIIIKSAPLDMELAELLGEKPGDFLILCFDGEQFEPYGTPWDTPHQRATWDQMVLGLNDRTKDSWWPILFKNWKDKLCAQYGLPDKVRASDPRPVASYKISRVAHGYSSHIHCAVGMFDRLGARLRSWEIGHGGSGDEWAEVVSDTGRVYIERGEGLARLIGLAVKRLLIAEGLPNDPTQARPKP